MIWLRMATRHPNAGKTPIGQRQPTRLGKEINRVRSSPKSQMEYWSKFHSLAKFGVPRNNETPTRSLSTRMTWKVSAFKFCGPILVWRNYTTQIEPLR